MHYLNCKRAFTLIELLIVVAIIAILAAIAVPNFLEAQTRAKVARVQSDMRSLTTALESYYVDHNNYVPNEALHSSYLAHATMHYHWADKGIDVGGFFYMLSTPVAYIANSFIEDPFMKGYDNKGQPYVGQSNIQKRYLRYTAFNKYGYLWWSGSPWTFNSPTTPRGMPRDGAINDSQISWWTLWSPGPDQESGVFYSYDDLNDNTIIGFEDFDTFSPFYDKDRGKGIVP